MFKNCVPCSKVPVLMALWQERSRSLQGPLLGEDSETSPWIAQTGTPPEARATSRVQARGHGPRLPAPFPTRAVQSGPVRGRFAGSRAPAAEARAGRGRSLPRPPAAGSVSVLSLALPSVASPCWRLGQHRAVAADASGCQDHPEGVRVT